MGLRPSKSRNAAMKKADKYYSLYVRQEAANSQGICQCVTCGKFDHWKNMQLGHWRRRGYQATRYDLRNTGVQCVRCNHFRSGEPERFEEYIRRQHGEKVVEQLRVKSLMNQVRKKYHFEQIAQEYYQKFKQLEAA